MNWKIKALIQKSIALLPSKLAGQIYFQLQYKYGKLVPYSMYDTEKAIFFLKQSLKHFGTTRLSCMEVGSGWTLYLPMALWLGGAEKIHTFDIHRYMKPLLLKKYISYWNQNRKHMENIFAGFTSEKEFNHKFNLLLKWHHDPSEILSLAGISYHAPADASKTRLENESIDLHFSTNVLEHISKNNITEILSEAKRILKPNGLLIHRVNPGDHFAHADTSISSINFLKYNQVSWDWWANNQFAYHNRLRANDLINIFEKTGFDPEILEQVIDDRALKLLKNGFKLNPAFREYKLEDLATLGLILKAIKN